MSQKKIVTIFTPQGEAKEYVKLSSRLPDFLAQYPPSEGYQVVIDYSDTLEVKPGLKALYIAAISAGRNPKDVGLPEITSNSMVFTAKLIKDGAVIATGSAMKPIYQLKDWEKGETAARQRLLAALGFGGEVFDEDEDGDMADQGLKVELPQAAASDVVPFDKPRAETAGAVRREEPEEEEQSQSAEPAASESQTSDAQAQSSQPTPETVSGEETTTAAEAPAERTSVNRGGRKHAEKATSSEGSAVSPALLRQIEHICKLQGIEVPFVSSNDEAKRELKNLMRNRAS